MEFKNWLQSVKDYMIDAEVKNPDAIIGKNRSLYNYFYLKKMLPEDVSLHFTDKLSKPTEADYLELIKLSRSPEYSDSMVYYRGKILGRCPAGTTKIGKTCAPAQKEELGAKYKKNVLGGLSRQQVARLSKAKSTEQIIEAHKEKDKEKTDD
tara:strand:+ start:2940 stop:3395 length:456 start_codon:yes stop_codon:yes gene_type:complete